MGKDEIAHCCAEVLASAGPMAALRFLNERTRFRFTGVYHAQPPLLRNLHLYDRENPTLNASGAVTRLDETYCAIVCTGDHPFTTTDAPADARLTAHTARENVISYCGVPIRHESGRVWGTLCHYDVRPRLVSPSEIEVLTLVAACFAQQLAGASRST
ncbi:MAG: GAF domain-containing protein [bacterium]